jgi:hypothetical protein
MAPVAGPERAPAVAHEAEQERDVERQTDPEIEGRELVGTQVQAVLEEEADRDADQAGEGRGEVEQDQQRAAVGQDVEAPRGRQRRMGRRRVDGRPLGGRRRLDLGPAHGRGASPATLCPPAMLPPYRRRRHGRAAAWPFARQGPS